MPVLLNVKYPGPERRAGLNWPRLQPGAHKRERDEFLHIGLVNNIGDAAMSATEDQFLTLLEEAAGDMFVHVTLYSLPEVERKAFGQRRVGSFYWNIEELWKQSPEESPDGLIVTGREPLARDLREESYWPSLKRVLAWTQKHARSAVWSCLAAHAAVLALDDIERVRNPQKQFGVFSCEPASSHPLLAGAPASLRIPHSRWNGIPADELAARGYQTLTHADDGAVDTFVKQDAGLFVFFQGHPEYESRTLLNEYRRDIGRYLRKEMENYPVLPRNYFTTDLERSLRSIEEEARITRRETILDEVSAILETAQIENTWRGTARLIYRNWLNHLWSQNRPSQWPQRAACHWNTVANSAKGLPSSVEV